MTAAESSRDGSRLRPRRILARLAFVTSAAVALFFAGDVWFGDGARAAPVEAARSPVKGYVGSASCAPCHASMYRDWSETLHSRMEQPATPASVKGAFTAQGAVVPIEAAAKRLAMIREGDAFYVEAPDVDGTAKKWKVDRTVGNRYKQRYLTKFADGSWHPLPVQWNQRDGTFVEWQHRASAKPGSGEFWADDAWSWQLKCAGCHTTGLDLGYDATKKTWDSKWNELAIGCESCHGPGESHVASHGRKEDIACPSRMSHSLQLDACGKCHSRGSAGPAQGAPAGLPTRIAYPFNMVPGTALEKSFTEVTIEKNPKEFWADGAAKNHHAQWNDYTNSGMCSKGGDKSPTCTTCHDPHRADALRAPMEDNRLCIRCHTSLATGEGLAKHTGHGGDPIANAGARCVECHMPRIVEHAGSEKLRSHTYRGPDPVRAKSTGTPDACLLCHKDRDAAWSAEKAAAIWPKRKPDR